VYIRDLFHQEICELNMKIANWVHLLVFYKINSTTKNKFGADMLFNFLNYIKSFIRNSFNVLTTR
jgi:hypothetical protein